jgi:uncharacterized glyoxalase superfamily protein PhnB
MDDAPALPAIPTGRDHRILRAGTWAGLVAATGFGLLTDAAFGAPSGIALMLGFPMVLLVVWLPFRRSAIGRAAYAVGSSEVAAYMSGVPIRRAKFVAGGTNLIDLMKLQIETPAEAERVFKALAAQGSVQMPIQETFWAQRFGMLVDRFGVPWIINCEKPQQ